VRDTAQHRITQTINFKCAALPCAQAVFSSRHPQRVIVPSCVVVVASRMHHGLQCDPEALQQAYPQRRLAIDTAQQIYTDGSGQTSAEGSGARIGAGVHDARSGREITIDPCGLGPTHTVHRGELVAIQFALQLCAGNEDVRILTDSQASMDGIRNYIQKPSHMQTHKYRDLLKDTVARLAARGRNNLRTTIAKIAAHTGIVGNERADEVAKRAAAPDAVTDHSQPLGNRQIDDIFWLQTYDYVTAEAKAQAQAGQIPEADQLSPGDRADGLASQPPTVVCRHIADLGTRGLQPHCHRRQRLGGSNLHTVYIEMWRTANAGLHGSLSNGVIWENGTPLRATVLVLKGSYGLIWTRNRAKMCNRSFRIAPGAPPEQSDLCLLCGAAADSVGHILSACFKIEAFHIARHNGAGLLSLKTPCAGVAGGLFLAIGRHQRGERACVFMGHSGA